MIQKDYGEWYIICDKCAEVSDAFGGYHEAVKGRDIAGFKWVKKDGKWLDVCIECYKEGV